MALKKGFLYRLTVAAAPVLYSLISSLLFSTCRVTHHQKENIDACDRMSGPFIAAFWHYSIFYVIQLAKGRSWVAMVSGSQDGEYISQLLRKMGYITVRGSRGKGGLRALKQMVTLMGEGKNAAIVADGSQGPPLIVQAGVILLASKTGAPVLPVAWAGDRCWIFRSWDRTVLPKPFSKIAMWYGDPLFVPKDIKSSDIEHYRMELEKRLNDLYSTAWAQFGIKKHW